MNMHYSQLVSDVTLPSSGTCLDHIYTNKCQHIIAALVENYALSDHLPTFAVRKYFKQSKSTNSHDSLESLRSTTRPAQQRGLNFSSRMSAKQFYCCNKCLKLFQITLQTAKFD
jgi:hypothetical protein